MNRNPMHKLTPALALAFSIAQAVAIVSPARAQIDAADTPLLEDVTSLEKETALEDATVLKQVNVTSTATKTERDIFDTPASISVINFTDMENRQVRSLGDAIKDLPGVEIGGGPRALAQQPEIRGLSGNRVLITVDGAKQNFNSGHKGRVFVDPELLKQIEVMRGPGSAVWGSGALGGVIAMTTKDADDFLIPGASNALQDNWGARVRTSWQSGDAEVLGTGTVFGKYTLDEVKTNEANDEAIDVILSGTLSQSDDIRLGGGSTLNNSGVDTYASLMKVGWQSGPGQRLRVSRQYQFESGEIPAQADAETSVTAVLTDRETEVILHQLNYQYEAPDNAWVDLYFNAYRNAQTIREKRIGTNGRLDLIDFDTDGIELRNSSVWKNTALAHRLTYGVEYSQDQQSATQGAIASNIFPDATATFFALYIQDEIDLNTTRIGDWIIVPGLRVDDYRSESDDAITSGVDIKTSERQWSPKIGTVYKLSQATNLTATYGRAFRAPNFQELYISGAHFGANNFEPNPNLKPEHGESIEFGVRHRRNLGIDNNDRLTLSASIYNNKYRDFIETIVTPASTTQTNTGKARIYGTEAEINYHLAKLALDAGLSLTIARGDDQVQDDPLSTISGDKWVLDLKRCLFRCTLSAGWRSSFHQRQTRVPDGQPETPGYATHDIYLTWQPLFESLDDMQINIGISNLTDKYYRQHLATLPDVGRSANISASIQF